MTTSSGLSPWAHPKSRRWYEAVLKQSGMLGEIEQFMSQPADQISISQCRVILAFLIVLGRPGIWPKEYNDILELAEKKVSQVVADFSGLTEAKLTLAEHQRQASVASEIQQELEILRRRIGKSRLKKKIGPPKTWRNFWN